MGSCTWNIVRTNCQAFLLGLEVFFRGTRVFLPLPVLDVLLTRVFEDELETTVSAVEKVGETARGEVVGVFMPNG